MLATIDRSAKSESDKITRLSKARWRVDGSTETHLIPMRLIAGLLVAAAASD